VSELLAHIGEDTRASANVEDVERGGCVETESTYTIERHGHGIPEIQIEGIEVLCLGFSPQPGKLVEIDLVHQAFPLPPHPRIVAKEERRVTK
jgi:hypothetical protein